MFGIDFSLDGLLLLFQPLVYQPIKVYAFIFFFMCCGSFGLPIPEEIVLISTGLIAHMAMDPVTSPPPYPGAPYVEVYTLMAVSLLAVLGSDFLVFSIGKYLGTRLMKYNWVKKHMDGKTYSVIQKWYEKYGALCSGIFRFTPGLRFPGHLSCGLMGIPAWKFLLIDGAAAMISVPTQIWLVAHYGRAILEQMQKYKLIVLCVAAVVFVVWLVKRRLKAREPQQTL